MIYHAAHGASRPSYDSVKERDWEDLRYNVLQVDVGPMQYAHTRSVDGLVHRLQGTGKQVHKTDNTTGILTGTYR